MTTIAPAFGRVKQRRPGAPLARAAGLPWLLASELLASVLGFAVLVRWARVLGPSGFSHVEYASAVAAWLLVLVRGGIEVIVYREAARRPRLVHRLTELLLGLRAVCAVAGYAIALAVALLVGRERGAVVVLGALVLVPSAFVADVLPRATGRLRWLALAQAVRALGFAASGFLLVWNPLDLWRAALCGVVAETLAWLVTFGLYVAEQGVPWPRFRRRASVVFAHRGAIASLTRFGRVTLYGIDVLALGWLAGAALGPFAAARRLVFALVALGLVMPTALGPLMARRWLEGSERARATVDRAGRWLWALSLPAAVGLALTSGRWMPALFGAGYRAGGPWLALVAARLPWVLSGSFSQAALVACRREREALRVVGAMLVLAAVIVPLGTLWAGPWGAGLAVLLVEIAGAAGGWKLLRLLGAAPSWRQGKEIPVLGSLMMAGVCWVLWPLPLWAVCLAGAAAYGLTWLACLLLSHHEPFCGGCPR
jgi:O-antigen/teichoic acid export membrane protein